mmetsp:Transcript_2665/g.9732  ORF Transcript_2665/g.9732 Transcript_2665/m.9732 type:complete len:275 (-) Transcript_2665:218-1042(-)
MRCWTRPSTVGGRRCMRRCRRWLRRAARAGRIGFRHLAASGWCTSSPSTDAWRLSRCAARRGCGSTWACARAGRRGRRRRMWRLRTATPNSWPHLKQLLRRRLRPRCDWPRRGRTGRACATRRCPRCARRQAGPAPTASRLGEGSGWCTSSPSTATWTRSLGVRRRVCGSTWTCVRAGRRNNRDERRLRWRARTDTPTRLSCFLMPTSTTRVLPQPPPILSESAARRRQRTRFRRRRRRPPTRRTAAACAWCAARTRCCCRASTSACARRATAR